MYSNLPFKANGNVEQIRYCALSSSLAKDLAKDNSANSAAALYNSGKLFELTASDGLRRNLFVGSCVKCP